jgi:nucleoside-diphosphate-sugar epimerase
MRLFIFGFGYSARAVVERLRPELDAVWGTTRDPAKLAEIEALGVRSVLFGPEALRSGPPPCTGEGDHAQHRGGGGHERGRRYSPPPPPSAVPLPRFAGEELSAALAEADHVLVSIPPGEAGDPVLNLHRADLAALKPKALVYLSTVGVYGDHCGAWVDEESECRPISLRSRQRLQAEAGWRLFAEETGVPVAIVRLAGIYGSGRGSFEKIRRGTARRIVKPGQVFNRIHVEDIAQIVEAALKKRAHGIFNGTDDEPAPPEDVLAFAADVLGVKPPAEEAFADADLSPMARSFYGENKRVRNRKIKDVLAVRLKYPTYRQGLRAILEAEGPAAHGPAGPQLMRG